MRPFVFAADIPYGFAIGILYITTQRGSPMRWDAVRQYWLLDSVLAENWLEQIIVDNKLNDPYNSIGWWKTQVLGQ